MPGSNPRLTTRTVFGRPRTDGMRSYMTDHGASRYAFYGYGKLAVRDGLDLLSAERPGATNVVLPAYLPHGIIESFRDAGLEPRYYRCDRRLRPNLEDIERLLDEGSLAVMLTHYFGHPQPPEDVERMRTLCEQYDAFLIDDNAHAPLSTSEGRLLGTLGDIGITSLRKMLPIPNGAMLFVPNETLPKERLTRSGVRDRYTLDDYRYCTRSLGRSVSGYPVAQEALSTVRWIRISGRRVAVDHKVADGGEDPREIYEDAKEPMSRLARRVFDRTDPHRVIAARRANYRIWDRAIRDIDGVEAVFSKLPDGVCPQYYTVFADDPKSLGPLAGISAPWPPLPREIRDNAEFETENYLATHLYTLPVHQELNLKGLGPLASNEQR
jgi:hypothetical protein